MSDFPDDPRATFRAALPARIAALEQAAQSLDARQSGALDSIRRLSHALRGSGGTYGFAEVSADAAALEEAPPAEVPALAERLLATLRAAAESGPTAQANILVVEDDPVVSALVQAALAAPGRTLYAVETTREAQEVIDDHEIALIVLDLVLPDADGRNLIVQLRESPRTARIPIVVISALLSAQVRTECFALGADEYVAKPLDVSVFAARIASLLARGPGVARAAGRLSGARAALAAVLTAGSDTAPPPAPAAPAPLTVAPLAGPILVAEDDDLIAAVITHRLTREGLEVRRYADGVVALEAARGVQAALVILDVKLPGMDGFELLRQLRTMPSYERVPVLMLTSMGSERDVARGLELGADDYISKPFSPVELVARVQRHLRRRRRVLLVDDDPLVIMAGRAALRSGGFDVDTAESAEAALAHIERERPDVVISDVGLPGLDGPALVARLRADPRTRDLQVVFLTARAGLIDVERALALGVRGVIDKPFDPLALADDVRRLLRD